MTLSKHYKKAILLLGIGGLMTSCDPTIHEYPDDVKSEVIIQPQIDRTAPLQYKEITYNDKWQRSERLLDPNPAAPYTLSNSDYAIRLILDLYRCRPHKTNMSMRKEELIERKVVEIEALAQPPQASFKTSLNDGDYCILAWADYIRKGEVKDTYYEVPSLIKINSKLSSYPSDMHLRSSSSGRQSFILDMHYGPTGYPILAEVGQLKSNIVPVPMSRPSSRYKLISSDYDAFLKEGGKLEGATVKVVYRQYVSVGYDVSLEEPNDFMSSYEFVSPILSSKGDAAGELFLVGDYLFTNSGKEDTVIADFFFYDAKGGQINHCTNIEIPLKRNHETVIKAPFLTKKVDNGGQVSIDEKFEGEHIIQI